MSYESAVLALSPFCAYHLEETTTVNLDDYGPGNRSGFQDGSVTYGVPGVVDNCFEFNGTNAAIRLPVTAGSFTTAWSFVFWWQYVSGTPVIWRDNTSSNGWLWLFASAADVTFRANGTNRTLSGLGTILGDGEWHACLISSTGTSIYTEVRDGVTGAVEFTDTWSFTVNASTIVDPIRFGKNGLVTSSYFPMVVDEPSLFTYALSSAQFGTLVDAVTAAPPGPPTSFSATPLVTTITISWSPPSAGGPVTHYEVRLDAGAWATTATSPASFTGLTLGTVYEVNVRAVGPGGNSFAVGDFVTTLLVPPPPPPLYDQLDLGQNLEVAYSEDLFAWTAIGGEVQSIAIHLDPMAASTLSVVLISDSLDPAVSDELRPNIAIRVRVVNLLDDTSAGQDHLFYGKLVRSGVEYLHGRPARITLSGIDALGFYDGVVCPNGYWRLGDIDLLLSDGLAFPVPAGVLAEVDGADAVPSGDGLVYASDGPSLLDQIAILRDSDPSYIWAGKTGVLQLWHYGHATMDVLAMTLTDTDTPGTVPYSRIDAAWSSEDVVNRLTVQVNQTITLGPYEDTTSQAAWGTFEKTVSVYNPDTGVVEADYTSYADDVFAAQPSVRPRSITVPVNDQAVLEAVTGVDLYSLVHVDCEGRIDADFRVQTIDHQIGTRIIGGWPRVVWQVSYTFGAPEAVPSVNRSLSPILATV